MPLPSPAFEPPSFAAPNTQAHSANPVPLDSILETESRETPLSSRDTSIGNNHAVEDKSLNAALTNSSTAAGQDKGKGKDPELYDVDPMEDGKTENRPSDPSMDYVNAVESLLQVQYIDAASALLDLATKPYECNVCINGDRVLCPVSPSLVNKDDTDHLYSSESEDEGTPLSTARKIGFSTSCHGNRLQLSAHESNAVFDLLQLSSRGNRNLPRHDLGLHNVESKCRCEKFAHPLYVKGNAKPGREELERGDTVRRDDGAVDRPRYEGYGAAEYDGDNHASEMMSRPAKLSQRMIGRLEADMLAWRPEPAPSTATSLDTPESVTVAVEPIRLPLYARESSTRASARTSTHARPRKSYT